MKLDDKVLTLDNGKSYIVMETLEFENKNYAYLSECNNPVDTLFVEIVNNDGLSLKQIDQKFLTEKLMPVFMEKLSRY